MSRLQHFLLTTGLVIVAATLTSCGDSRLVTKGPPPEKPVVRVTGPTFLHFSFATEQYEIDKNSFRSETLTKTFSINPEDSGSVDIPLDDGFDGLLVELQTSTDQPVTMELFLDGKLHTKVESTSRTRLRIAAGNTLKDTVDPVDIRLDADEQKTVEKILDSMNSDRLDELQSLISDDDPKHIHVDALLLQEMMRVAAQRYGGGIKDNHSLRWSKIEANDNGAINYRLPLEFEDGTLFVTDLIVLDGKLVAVRLKNAEFEKDWWQDAAYGETYANRSRTLIAAIIEKRYADAYALLGFEMKENVTIEQLQGYREQIQQLPDTGISEIALQDTRDTLQKDEVTNGAKQYFLVTFTADAPVFKVDINNLFTTGRTFKEAEIIGFEFKAQ